jgi:hypothetical protein
MDGRTFLAAPRKSAVTTSPIFRLTPRSYWSNIENIKNPKGQLFRSAPLRGARAQIAGRRSASTGEECAT